MPSRAQQLLCHYNELCSVMAIDTGEQPSRPAHEELVFLCRSLHRLELLGQLSREPQARRELHEATDISQPTLGRILGDFEQRRWVSNHHNGAYSLSPLGQLLSRSLENVLDVLETTDQLAGLVEHFPFDRLDFDPAHLVTATITTPMPGDPLAHMRRFDELAEHGTTVRMFSNVLACAPSHETSGTDREFLAHIDELIVTHDAMTSGLDDGDLKAWLGERVEDNVLSIYRYDESANFLFAIFDKTVGLVPLDDEGMPCGLIESTAEPVRTWVIERFEAYRRNSTRLDAEDLSR